MNFSVGNGGGGGAEHYEVRFSSTQRWAVAAIVLLALTIAYLACEVVITVLSAVEPRLTGVVWGGAGRPLEMGGFFPSWARAILWACKDILLSIADEGGRMHVIYLAGGIASGKSTIARTMRECGATLIDLDELSREALAPGSRILPDICREFGDDVVRPDGTVNRRLLASRAFASMERSVTLEEIELPLIDELLRARVAELRAEEDAARAEAEKNGDPAPAESVVVVEVPLLDRMRGSFDLADEEFVCVVCPLNARRFRAIQRGMDRGDFGAGATSSRARRTCAPTARTSSNNIRTADVMAQEVRDWWKGREEAGWAPVSKGARHEARP